MGLLVLRDLGVHFVRARRINSHRDHFVSLEIQNIHNAADESNLDNSKTKSSP